MMISFKCNARKQLNIVTIMPSITRYIVWAWAWDNNTESYFSLSLAFLQILLPQRSTIQQAMRAKSVTNIAILIPTMFGSCQKFSSWKTKQFSKQTQHIIKWYFVIVLLTSTAVPRLAIKPLQQIYRRYMGKYL